MAMDHVRSVSKLHAAGLHFFVGSFDVIDAQIEDGLCVGGFLLLTEKQPNAAAVEERELVERVQMRQAEHRAVPMLRLLDVPDGARYLTDRTQLERHRKTPCVGKTRRILVWM